MKNKSLNLPWAKINSFTGNHTSPALTTYRPCPICGGLHSRTLLVFDDFQFYSDSAEQPKRTQIREVQCQSCHAVYLNPCYTNTGFDYLFAEAGQSYGSTDGRPQEQIDWMVTRGLLDDDKVFLDAGCYDGRFLSGLPKSIRRIGVDIDAPAITRGQERYGSDGVELIHGAFETFQCPVAPDVISMFHVLEHLANPVEVLCHLRSISHDETRLIVEVPILEYGKNNDINGFLSAQHMTHFSAHSLGKLMARTGWEILERQQMPDYNGHRILVKPGESSDKVMGDVSDRTRVSEYFENWYRNQAEVARKIESWPRASRIVIWGGGMHSEFLYQVTPLFQQDLQCEYIVVDSDPLKQGKSWRGLPILNPDVIQDVDWDDCLLVISSYGGQEAIARAAVNLNVPDSVISRLYDFVKVY
ncbi:MAG: class I SAM-dependent methyltransferase [Methylobacter sp.]|uniref:Class I SAM-dependent methyltransferase n=1 Tax=Candidatus Methylobacter titanis TaxID=3053457 RepID=A0AA43TQF3_9GAMM|nr:class I SAM-dependent methyltransferase [Candidatus Methylobacter titanis]